MRSQAIRFEPPWALTVWVGLAVALALGIAVLPLKWAAVLVAGGITMAATVVRPQVGVLLLVAAVPFGSLVQVSIGVASFGLTEGMVLLLLGSWLMRLATGSSTRLTARPLTISLVVLLGVLGLSLPGTRSLEHSIAELVKWLEVVAVFLMVATEIHGRWIDWVVIAMLATGGLAAVQGIGQFLSGSGPESFLLYGRFVRAYGSFEQPNPYAGYLGLCLPLALGLLGTVLLRRRDRVPRRWLALAAGAAGLMLCAIGMSWSRGAWVGVAASMGAISLALLARSARARLWGSLALAAVAVVLLLPGPSGVRAFVSARFGDFVPYLSAADVRTVEITDENYAVVERLAHWQAALGMWTAHPWLGVGIGNYEVAYSQFALPAWPEPLGHAHNYYLNIAAEAGLLGLCSFLLLYLTALVQAWRSSRQASGLVLGVALGVLGAMAHLGVHSLFDNLFVHGMYLHLAILLGLLRPPSKERLYVDSV